MVKILTILVKIVEIIQGVFTPKIPKKLIFPQIETIIQGTLLTFQPKKVKRKVVIVG